MTKISTDTRTFKSFRLEIAESILRNNPHLSLLSVDIDSHAHIIELCDTYAMRLLLSWLGTKCGCLLSPKSIQEIKPDKVPAVERIFLSVDIYPFAQNFPISNDQDLLNQAYAFLDEAFQPSIELAGSLHEHMTSHELEFDNSRGESRLHMRSATAGRKGRRKKGQFYTPPWVVDYCLDRSLREDLTHFMKALQQPKDIDRDNESHNSAMEPTKPVRFRILDPACGTGNFLLGVVRFLIAQGAPADAVFKAACQCIYGRDLDGKAISIAIWSIAISVCEYVQKTGQLVYNRDENRLWEPGSTNCRQLDFSYLLKCLCDHLHVTDSVFESCSAKSAIENSNSISRNFDLVITNPPYISFGSRNQETILPSTSTFLRKQFPISAEYKIRLNSIFQEVALNYVRDGGKVCLFIPNGFLTGQGYAKLRGNLLRKTRIISLSELPEDTIKSAVVGRWCVSVYQRNDGSDDDLSYEVELASIKSSVDRTAHLYRLKASHLVTKDQSRFRLVFQEIDEKLALKIDKLPLLSSVMRGHTGIRARNGQKSIIADRKINARYKPGIKSGAQVTPFSAEWDGTWLHVEPKLLFAGGFDELVVENPKILVRQTADRIIAAYDDKGLYHLNNVHSFSDKRARSQSQIDLHLYVALMNSNFWNYLYHLKTREDGRALAQIDIETVQSMPVPTFDEALEKVLAKIAHLSKCFTENRSHLSVVETLKEINQLVYCAYALSDDEIQHVESSVGVGYNSSLLKTGAG